MNDAILSGTFRSHWFASRSTALAADATADACGLWRVDDPNDLQLDAPRQELTKDTAPLMTNDPLQGFRLDLHDGVVEKDDAIPELLAFRQLQLRGGAVRIEAPSCAGNYRAHGTRAPNGHTDNHALLTRSCQEVPSR
jgi:hypothetical protein